MPTLILLKAPGGTPGHRYAVGPDSPALIGRDADLCQVVIPNGSVSRRHAVIAHDGNRFTIEDLGSRNGTYVNQNRANGPVAIKSEDRIKICDYLFRFHDEADAPTPQAPVESVPPVHNDGTVMLAVNQAGARSFLEAAPAERLRALLEISTALSRTLALDPLLPAIADSLFSCFRQADRCFVILLDENKQMVAKVAKSLRGDRTEPVFSRSIVKRCLDSLQSYLTEDATGDQAFSAAVSVAEFRIRSAMCVPLVSGSGEALGAIQLDCQDLVKRFRDDDLKLLTIVANIASVAVEKAQVHAELITREKERGEVEIARKVQAGFLPNVFPQIEGYEFFAFYSPAQSVGGDYYDFVNLPGGRLATVLGDVAGKGVAAALLMAKLSAEVRFALLTEPDLASAVSLLNELLIEGGIGDRFVTLVALVLDPTDHTVVVVNAGHINPVKVTAEGNLSDAVTNDQSGLPLGLVSGYQYEATAVKLEPGESILLYTDGVTDSEDPKGLRFGIPGVHDSIESIVAGLGSRPASIGGRLVAAVQLHGAGRAQSDDIAVVCLGRPSFPGPPPTIRIRPAAKIRGGETP